MISFCIVTWNNHDLLTRCVRSIRLGMAEAFREPYEIVIVDNASQPAIQDTLAQNECETRIVRNSANRLFAIGTNQSVSAAFGDYLVIINDDIEFPAGTLPSIVDRIHERSNEVIAFSLVYSDGKQQASVRAFPTPLRFLSSILGIDRVLRTRRSWLLPAFDYDKEQLVEQPMFSALAMPRSVWDQVGDLDPLLPLLYNDVEWFHRARRKGVRCRYIPAPKIIHHHGRSVNKHPFRKILRSAVGQYRYIGLASQRPVMEISLMIGPIALFVIQRLIRELVRRARS